ncbi:hypothetical protein Tco_1123129 [Tanacetum coccineum]|uniref:Uncharacterized protein n=1 Tax=Tanacetum coccineum TaxID=301880 RepID=A0ABQ5J2H2_9ASTR
MLISRLSSLPLPLRLPVDNHDSRMEEIDLFLASDDSMPPGIENDDYDLEGDIHDDYFPSTHFLIRFSTVLDYPRLSLLLSTRSERLPVFDPDISPLRPVASHRENIHGYLRLSKH